MSAQFSSQKSFPMCLGVMALTLNCGILWLIYVHRPAFSKGIDPLGPMLFSLVLQKLVATIAADEECLHQDSSPGLVPR